MEYMGEAWRIPVDLDDYPWEEEVVPVSEYDERGLAATLLASINHSAPGELATLKGALYDFLRRL